MRLNLFCFVTLLFISAGARAQPDKYRFSQFGITKGLSHNQVNAIVRDKKGFMWFGTMSGLNRFDGYKFKVFKHELNNPVSINDDYINIILNGPRGKLWVLTRVSWQVYDPLTESFDNMTGTYLKKLGIADSVVKDIREDRHGNFWFLVKSGVYYLAKNSERATYLQPRQPKIDSSTVSAISLLQNGAAWLLHDNGVLEQIDAVTRKIISRVRLNNTGVGCKLYCDNEGDLWLYNTGIFNGVQMYSPASGKLHSLNTSAGPMRLSNNIISGIAEDRSGLLWFATDHGGINIINKKKQTITYVVNNANDDKSLAQNVVLSVYADNDGGMWLGTFKKGLSYYKQNALTFPLYKHNPYNAGSLQYDDVNRFVEDAKGNIWIGTNGGGLIKFDPKTNSFNQYLRSNTGNSITNDVIVSLWVDKKQVLWIGTYFGGLDSFDGKNFTHYRHNAADPNSISDDRVWEIYEDSQGRMWIGTLSGGLDLFDQKKKKFYHHKKGGQFDLHSNYVAALTEDSAGNLWIGTSDGVDILEKKTNRFISLKHNEKDNTTISNDNVIAVFFDSRKLMWIATREGLDVFDQHRNKLYTFRKEHGLPDNTVLTVIEDKLGRIWVSTPNGLSAITIGANGKGGYAFTFTNYDESDGLQGREFNENAAFNTSSGKLMFGGAGGFNMFDPATIITDRQAPTIVFTDLQLFNKSIGVDEKAGSGVILKKAITETTELVLPYNINVFSVEFAAFNFVNPYKSQFTYKMEGFNKEWLSADAGTRKATFTNLNEGTYTLHVRASNESGVWNNKGISLKIKILPPFWRTTWAYIVYVLIAGAVLYLVRRNGIQKLKSEFAIEQERQEARRMHEVDLMKIKFFTNISHEFRTPLALIISPAEKLLKHTTKDDDKRQYQLIHRNARRLLNLVNQLLDFRKLEAHELKLHTRRGNIAEFLKDVCQSFTDVADKKNISFSFNSSVTELYAAFDHEKVERIMFNLLSNAFKFTPENGAVVVKIVYNNKTHHLTIIVQDNGIGIKTEKQDKVFDRFFQEDIPDSIMNQGSGIGLSIVREFVKIHHGTINLESEAGKGATFTIILPLKALTEPAFEQQAVAEEIQSTDNVHNSGLRPAVSRKAAVLVVEDNEDFRGYIRDNLSRYFNVTEAVNGKEGWQKALAMHPDIVVSDISMPEMDGNELCRRIRTDARTRHIPVILLTALTGEDQQLKGLETGASDYMTKPFSFEVLVFKISNLIKQQESFKKTYQKQIEIKQDAPLIESQDEKLLKRIISIIEAHIADPELSVEDLSKKNYMSRVGLYKKMLQLTGKTPVEYIKHVRLERAVQLLEKSQLNVSEIAYKVGFSNPKYFTKVFKAEFGILPSAYVKREN